MTLAYQQNHDASIQLQAIWNAAARRVSEVVAMVLVWNERDGRVPDIAWAELREAHANCEAAKRRLLEHSAWAGKEVRL